MAGCDGRNIQMSVNTNNHFYRAGSKYDWRLHTTVTSVLSKLGYFDPKSPSRYTTSTLPTTKLCTHTCNIIPICSIHDNIEGGGGYQFTEENVQLANTIIIFSFPIDQSILQSQRRSLDQPNNLKRNGPCIDTYYNIAYLTIADTSSVLTKKSKTY